MTYCAERPGLVSVNRDETVEMLGPCLLVQKREGHRLTTDALLLADFATEALKTLLPSAIPDGLGGELLSATHPSDTHSSDSNCSDCNDIEFIDAPVVDIGTGNGAIAIMLALRSSLKSIAGIEVQTELSELARRNVGANKLKERISIENLDYRELPARYKAGTCALVVSNPPYIKAGSGRVSGSASRHVARNEVYGNLTDLVRVSSYLVGGRGSICFIYPVKRYGEMLKELKQAELKVKRVRFIHSSPGGDAIRFLIEAGRTGGNVTEEPIFL